MKKKVQLCLFMMIHCIAFIYFTEQRRVRRWGLQSTINLPQNKKLVFATSEGDDIWYLMREMQEDEEAKEHTFYDNITGLPERSVTFVEHSQCETETQV